MASPKPSASWQHMRRLLASKSKNELLNLLRDLYILNTDNKDFIHAQVLTPKPTTPKTRQPKQPLTLFHTRDNDTGRLVGGEPNG
jgi:hypothetical protein